MEQKVDLKELEEQILFTLKKQRLRKVREAQPETHKEKEVILTINKQLINKLSKFNKEIATHIKIALDTNWFCTKQEDNYQFEIIKLATFIMTKENTIPMITNFIIEKQQLLSSENQPLIQQLLTAQSIQDKRNSCLRMLIEILGEGIIAISMRKRSIPQYIYFYKNMQA